MRDCFAILEFNTVHKRTFRVGVNAIVTQREENVFVLKGIFEPIFVACSSKTLEDFHVLGLNEPSERFAFI
ncbi:hypothetical protein OHAE_5103 [Ochrobactrum soli]|uniref:Uncharacterized protein n=1 Tax=Ochrobactrum soli TaxID=2448455 RepID=A0A2P9HEH2_9HYPH|nr:hypothetical protein OHAE_5103 [[Ochrobactrum] soli]